MPVPTTEEDWLKIFDQFEELWNILHAVGALDRKHIQIESPKLSGSLYHNYKGFSRIILLAACDARYCFTLFDLDQHGSNNDSSALANSTMGKLFEDNSLKLRDRKSLNETKEKNTPFYLLGDEIFPLKTWLMRPFPGRNAD